MAFITAEKTGRRNTIMRNYSVMFMFGVIFTMLMLAQGLLLNPNLFYLLEVVELVGVYFIIKSFTNKEMGGK